MQSQQWLKVFFLDSFIKVPLQPNGWITDNTTEAKYGNIHIQILKFKIQKMAALCMIKRFWNLFVRQIGMLKIHVC